MLDNLKDEWNKTIKKLEAIISENESLKEENEKLKNEAGHIDDTNNTPEPIRSISIDSIPDELYSGDSLSISSTGIGEEERIFYHLFDKNWGNLIAETIFVDENDNINIIVPEVSTEERIFQLQTKGVKVQKNIKILKRSETKPDPIPEPTLNSKIKTLKVGSGWASETPVPGKIGSAHEVAIAHWNVVPEQSVEEGFTAGIIAHHLDGIDRVEFSANNGPWVAVKEETINPRTKCVEYFVSLKDLGEKPIKLRAIAYPKSGQPVLVKPLGSSYSKEDMTLYPYEEGTIVELDKGEHNISNIAFSRSGWTIVKPKSGVKKEDCIIVGKNKFTSGKGRLKLEGLTINLPWGGSGLMGKYMVTDKAQLGNHIWLDNCRVKGAKLGNKHEEDSWWIAHIWETQTYTDCEISHISKPTFAFRRNKNLIRNCYYHDIYEDLFNTSGLMVNVVAKDMNRQVIVDAQNLEKADWPHPDFWQSNVFKDTIIQDVTALDNIVAQGLFVQSGRVENVAVVRTKIKVPSPWRAFAPEVPISNWLLKECMLQGGTSRRGSIANGERFKAIGCTNEDGTPWKSPI